MIELQIGHEFPASFADAALLALWAVPPALVFAFIRCAATVRRTQPEFSLRKSETAEWNRAVTLYGRVCREIDEVESRGKRPKLFDRLVFGCRAERTESDAETLTDLQTHAAHLHAMVVRLNRQPLDRLRSWLHLLSVRFAVGYAVGAYVVGFTLLIAAAELSKRWIDPAPSNGIALLLWCPLGPHVCANAISIAFATLAGPVVYVLRRLHLRRIYRVEFGVFKDLARAEPQHSVWLHESGEIEQNEAGEAARIVAADRGECFEIFGLSPSASLEELRKAYKALIKQNHPDRVHGMSPAFVKLAETETRRLNAAYQEALVSIMPNAAKLGEFSAVAAE